MVNEVCLEQDKHERAFGTDRLPSTISRRGGAEKKGHGKSCSNPACASRAAAAVRCRRRLGFASHDGHHEARYPRHPTGLRPSTRQIFPRRLPAYRRHRREDGRRQIADYHLVSHPHFEHAPSDIQLPLTRRIRSSPPSEAHRRPFANKARLLPPREQQRHDVIALVAKTNR